MKKKLNLLVFFIIFLFVFSHISFAKKVEKEKVIKIVEKELHFQNKESLSIDKRFGHINLYC